MFECFPKKDLPSFTSLCMYQEPGLRPFLFGGWNISCVDYQPEEFENLYNCFVTPGFPWTNRGKKQPARSRGILRVSKLTRRQINKETEKLRNPDSRQTDMLAARWTTGQTDSQIQREALSVEWRDDVRKTSVDEGSGSWNNHWAKHPSFNLYRYSDHQCVSTVHVERFIFVWNMDAKIQRNWLRIQRDEHGCSNARSCQ